MVKEIYENLVKDGLITKETMKKCLELMEMV